MNWQEKQMWLLGISWDENMLMSANERVLIDVDNLPDFSSDPAQLLLQFEEQGGRPFSARSRMFR